MRIASLEPSKNQTRSAAKPPKWVKYCYSSSLSTKGAKAAEQLTAWSRRLLTSASTVSGSNWTLTPESENSTIPLRISSLLMPKQAKKSPRQIIFVREYIKDFNGTRAALAAGCPKASAHVTASRWLKLAKIQADIERCIGRTTRKYDISADSVLGELAKLGFSNMADYTAVQADGSAVVDLSGVSRDKMAAVEAIETREYIEPGADSEDGRRVVRNIKIKLSNKREALELLGKHLRLFNDPEQSARGGVQVILVDIPRPDRPAIDVTPTNGALGNGHNGNGNGNGHKA